MPSLLKTIIHGIQEDFGRPASLYALLDDYPDLSCPPSEPARNIASESVVRWHEWGGKDGDVLGWQYDFDTYQSFRTTRSEFANFGICKITEVWKCDIQDVDGLANSKTKLQDFDTLDRMVETKAPDLIDPITAERLRENLEYYGIRILHEKHSDFFASYLWDGRVFLINSDGSHHFAAARYIAARIGAPVPLRGMLRTYAINERAVAALQRDYEMFVITDTLQAGLGFHDAMKNFRASYLWKYLPRPYRDCRAILLPRSDARSMKVANVMREAGTFDLGLYLRGLVARQYRPIQP